jgi:[glutamine synthetase] adenylyltransferase / [glutamine synthetase]-adenylyl-L-tyrosine phosphorylase
MTSVPVHKMSEALERADHYAPYLRMLMLRFPGVVARLSAGNLSDSEPSIDKDLPVRTALRQAKARQALALAIGDLAGVLSLESVMMSLSKFADTALDLAIAEAIEHLTPGGEQFGLAAIALGKHGSFELNYSSDIDPILIFDPEILPRRKRDDPVEAAVRVGRRVVETMQARDGDGYVFRIDLRLRPTPEVTPIVLPIDAAIAYYESNAVPWERAAFIRSRACAGDQAIGDRFLDAIQPFVWRRGLDFGAIGEIRNISRRIRDHHASGQIFGPGFDLKRGRGGIREVEFFAQIHQLIFGGREAQLRAPATLEALSALADAGRIDAADAQTLGTAYRLYRTIEHRLQMIDDQQTHMLPKQSEALEAASKLHGLADGPTLLELLQPHIEAVGRIYDALDGTETGAVSHDENRLGAELGAAGFDDSDHAAKRIGHWRSGTIRSLRTSAARDALEAVLSTLIVGIGGAPDPNHALNQLSNLIERLPSAINLFRLLEARPALLKLLINIVSHAPRLAEQLAGRADLLDSLIDATALDPLGSVDALATEMELAGDLEQQLDHVRRVVGEHRFALGVQVIEGASDPLNVAKGYARLAEAAVRVVADASVANFERNHGRVPGSEFVILALGRMGGAELTHASDLDLIFLFTGDFSVESDGVKPLGAVHYFNRLAQRVIAGLSVPTTAGPLYEIDTRLRPSGAKGPLAISLTAFEKYQRDEAWTWEHMALARARVVYGSDQARAETAAIVAKVLNAPRDPARLISDAVKMRADMARHKVPVGPLDVKLLAGGLVDLEFGVHVIQLVEHAGFSPDLADAIAALVDQELIPKSLIEAHQLLTRLLVTARLVAPDLRVPPPSTQAIVARACGAENWAALLEDVTEKRQSVEAFWARYARPQKDMMR